MRSWNLDARKELTIAQESKAYAERQRIVNGTCRQFVARQEKQGQKSHCETRKGTRYFPTRQQGQKDLNASPFFD